VFGVRPATDTWHTGGERQDAIPPTRAETRL